MQLSPFQRFQRNHAIEHAAMHLLGRLPQRWRLVARSDWDGFTMYGQVDTEALAWATQEGLRALQGGQRDLAIHPHCGTNLVVTALLAAAAYRLVSATGKGRRSPHLLALSMIAAVAAFGQPLNRAAQARLFTSADLSGATVIGIEKQMRGGVPVHRVNIRHE
jgi:hypothetical protein